VLEEADVANPDQMKMLQQIQKMQADMAAAQDALESETVEASAGGGVVKAIVNGHGDLKRITIDVSVVDPDDVETLEDLVVAAVTEGVRQARDLQQQRMGAVTNGLGIGGGGGGVDDLFGGLLGK
jgi:DNA-binding YbaB/EbfC family protein